MLDKSPSEDIDMQDIGGENHIKQLKKLIVGSAELGFKRDNMEI